jgi:hypothetical protein
VDGSRWTVVLLKRVEVGDEELVDVDATWTWRL